MPLQKKHIKRETQLKWMSPEIMALLTSCNSLFKKAKQSNNPDDWNALKCANHKVTHEIKSAKKNFFHESLQENRSKPKKLWASLRNIVGKEKTFYGISFLEENGSQIRDSAQIAEIFNTRT